MASMNTRLNIEKLDGNIVQKHGGSKQVGFKQLGPGVETGVHGVSNDDTALAQRRLEDKQPEEKTNKDCLVKEQEKEYQTGWKIKTGDCDAEKNGKWSCIYAVGSQKYQMVCTRLDIASADVGMLDKFDRGLQTDVQVFVDFDYAMGRSIT
ncbi:hypothetical protein Tco_1085751, partial [Tanacetum coccineum]